MAWSVDQYHDAFFSVTEDLGCAEDNLTRCCNVFHENPLDIVTIQKCLEIVVRERDRLNDTGTYLTAIREQLRELDAALTVIAEVNGAAKKPELPL